MADDVVMADDEERVGLAVDGGVLHNELQSASRSDIFGLTDRFAWLDRLLTLEVAVLWALSLVILYPHTTPFENGQFKLVSATLYTWDTAGLQWLWFFAIAVVTYVIARHTLARHHTYDPSGRRGEQRSVLWWLTRPKIRLRVGFLVIGIGIFVGATIYSQIILPQVDHSTHDWPSELWMCKRWCGNPWLPCVMPPKIRTGSAIESHGMRVVARNTTKALGWWRDNVFGSVKVPVTATMLDDSTMRVVVGPSSKGLTLTQVVTFSSPGRDNASFFIGEGSGYRAGPQLANAGLALGPRGEPYVFMLLGEQFAWPSRSGDDDCPRHQMRFQSGRASSNGCALGGSFAVGAAVLNAMKDALHTRFTGITVAVYGASRGGKVAAWAVSSYALHAAKGRPAWPFDSAYIHMGGTLGPGSIQYVGPCAETWDAIVTRWPQWFSVSAPALPRHPGEWPYDVADYMIAGCQHTHFSFSVDATVLWKNYMGNMHSIAMMRAAGCKITVVDGIAPTLTDKLFVGAVTAY